MIPKSDKVIKFYGRTKPDPKYWPFSNFYSASFFYKNKLWKTSEHAYQAMKFNNEMVQETIRLLKTPKEAAIMGRKLCDIKHDWDSIKDEIMYDVCLTKFSQNEDIKRLLVSTEDAILVEDSQTDDYWGCGDDGAGQNKLGFVLMKVRENLRSN